MNFKCKIAIALVCRRKVLLLTCKNRAVIPLLEKIIVSETSACEHDTEL